MGDGTEPRPPNPYDHSNSEIVKDVSESVRVFTNPSEWLKLELPHQSGPTDSGAGY